MKLGILDALSLSESYENRHNLSAGTYIEFLDSANAPFEYAVYDVCRCEYPADLQACDAYLVTGSVKGAYDDEPWIGRLITFLQESHAAGIKLVGICFGHQVLAHALGGRSEKSEKGWGQGLRSFDIVATKPWMEGQGQQCALYYSHQDQVVQLPDGAELLGSDGFCENAFFAIGDQVLGIQGHPEFSTEIMREILANPKETGSAAVHETAVRSLENGRPDSDLVARWIVNFLTA